MDDRSRVPIRFGEFVALSAAMMSTQAIAIDAMLPAFPAIIGALKVGNPNHGQWIVTTYMAGLGTGQLVWGLLSDRFGRRPIVLGGMCLYVVAALVCGMTRSFEALLAWRFVHGLAAASATVVRSIVRDLYSGRPMARVLSLTFVVFLMVPVVAPSLGQAILWMASWRYIFFACGMFATIVWLYALLRLPETLHPQYRLPLDPSHILRAVRIVVLNRVSMFYTLATTALFGALIAYVGMVQQIFSDVFHRPGIMPLMFALCAGFMGVAAFTNSRLVGRLGMRLISHTRDSGVHRHIGAACDDRGARLGAAMDLRGASGGDDGDVQPVGVELRRHGDGAGRSGRGSRRIAAGVHLDGKRGDPCRGDRQGIQRHHTAARHRVLVLRVGRARVRAGGGAGPAVPSTACRVGVAQTHVLAIIER